MNELFKPLYANGRFTILPKKLFYKSKELNLNTIEIITISRVNYHREDFPIPYCLLAKDDSKYNYTKKQMKKLKHTGRERYLSLKGKNFALRDMEEIGVGDEWKAVPISIEELDCILLDLHCDIDYNPDQDKFMKYSRWSPENMANGFIMVPKILLERPLGLSDRQRVFILCLLSKDEYFPLKDSNKIFPFDPRTVKKRRDELVKMGLIKAVKTKDGWKYNMFRLFKLMLEEETGKIVEERKGKIFFESEEDKEKVENLVDVFHNRIDHIMNHMGSLHEKLLKINELHKEDVKDRRRLKKLLAEFEEAKNITFSTGLKEPSYDDIPDKIMRFALMRWNDAMDRPEIDPRDIKLANNPIFARLFLSIDQRLFIKPVLTYMYKEKHQKRKIKSMSIHAMNGAYMFQELATMEGYHAAKQWAENETGYFSQAIYHEGGYERAAKELCYKVWDDGISNMYTNSNDPDVYLNIYNRMRGLDKYLDKIYTPTA